jgi:hypothetical protein
MKDNSGEQNEARGQSNWVVGGPDAYEPLVTPSLDTVFELLSDSNRRYAMYCLIQAPNGVKELSELVTDVLRLRAEIEGIDPTDEVRESLRIELHHKHLPKLQDENIIEYDTRSEHIRYWAQPTIEEWTEHVVELTRSD